MGEGSLKGGWKSKGKKRVQDKGVKGERVPDVTERSIYR